MSTVADRLGPYSPRMLRQWLEETPDATWREVEGTTVFIDISGFTQLSERLSRAGPVGAEELTEAIGTCFADLLAVAYEGSGSLLKFGGDALLLLFTADDHLGRACRAAIGMRQRLAHVGDLRTSAGRHRLKMSVGVHSGLTQLFLVGGSHREPIVTGPATTAVVAAESAADTGEIVVSGHTALQLPRELLGPARGDGGHLLLSAPPGLPAPIDTSMRWDASALLTCVPVALRAHLLAEQHDAEHRRVTVAFLRFAGVDDRIRTEGPDAMAEMLDTTVRAVQDAVDRHEVAFLGTDVDVDGGKILLASGAPSSGGNDEERMLLALRDLVVQDLPLPIRVGVNVGHVFAGDIGPVYRRTYTVMGDAVNLAARVMGRAEPGQIVATEPVLSASHTTFEVTDLEPFHVKGKTDPVVAVVVGPSLSTRATAAAHDLPFVGREQELATFAEVLRAAADGSGRLVELTGEAGIGKSRLLEAVRAQARPIPVHVVVAELHRVATPYGTLRKLLQEALDLPPDAAEAERARRLLETLRSDLPDLLPWSPLLGMALGIELPATDVTANLDDRFVRPRLHEALIELLDQLWDGPVLLTIEDAQWLDEASADAVRAITAALTDRPWVIVTARRGPDPDVAEHAPLLRVALEPLDGDAATSIAAAATESNPFSPHDLAAVVARSGGNPLFLQELLVAAVDAGGVDALPDSVGSLVTARIDRLPPPQRSALREVSVLGLSFPRELARAVLTKGDTSQLDRLSDFLVDDGATTRFRHAIIREVAYEALPYRRRRRLHEAAGDTIAARGLDQPELLSVHYHLAGRYADAWKASRIAGDRAAAVYANVDAVRFYERAVAAAQRLDDLDPTAVAAVSESLGDTRRLLGDAVQADEAYRAAGRILRHDPVAWARLKLKQARVQAHLKRYPSALATITRALRHLDGHDDRAARGQRAQLLVWYAHFRLDQGKHADALRWSHLAIAEAEAAEEPEALGHGYRLLDWAHVDRGEPELATYSARAIELYEELGDLSNLANVRNNLGGIAYWRGNWDAALEHYTHANELDEQTGDVIGAALGRNNIAEILADQGRWEEAEHLFRDAERVVRAARHASATAYVRSNLGRTLGRLGRYDEALTLLTEARDTARDIGAGAQVVEAEARLAELHVLRGLPDEALTIIERAIRPKGAADGVAAQEPLLHRLRGYALMQKGRTDEARAALERSLAAAASREADYEQALTERALADLTELETGKPDTRLSSSSQATLDRLGVERLPMPSPRG